MAGVISIIILNQQKGLKNANLFSASRWRFQNCKKIDLCSAHIYPMKSSIVFPSPLYFVWP